MKSLGADQTTMSKYKKLKKKDLKTDTAVMSANEPSHRNNCML